MGFQSLAAGAIARAEKEPLVKALCERIEKVYVFTENIKKVCDLLKGNLRRGAYEGIATPREFAGRLNDDIGGWRIFRSLASAHSATRRSC